MNASFVLTSASLACTKDQVDRGRVICETSTSDAFVLVNDALVSMNASMMRTSDAFASGKAEHKASERPARGQREASVTRARGQRGASTERAKGQRKPSERLARAELGRATVCSGFSMVAMVKLQMKKAARLSGLFLFLPSTFRIPSLTIKPAKFLRWLWRGSRVESCVITLGFSTNP
jgi:hypothetical protein